MLELKLDQIEVHFGNHHVLKGLNATFDAGKIHSVIGINGAGKSVLLKTIAGLIHGSGQVLIRDQECEYNMSDIAYVPQMAYSTSVLTAFEMVLLGKVKSLSWKVSKEIIQEVNEYTGDCQVGWKNIFITFRWTKTDGDYGTGPDLQTQGSSFG